MTPSQTQALQEVKDEVAKKYGYDNFSSLTVFIEDLPVDLIFNESMQLYHTRLLAEAGKDVKFLRDEFYKENTRLESDGKIVEFKHMPHYVFQWFEEKVSTLLSAKQAEIGQLKEMKEIDGKTIKHMIESYSESERQLQEAKAEVERFSQFKEWIDKMIEAEHRGGDLSYKQHRIVYEKIKEQITKPQ